MLFGNDFNLLLAKFKTVSIESDSIAVPFKLSIRFHHKESTLSD